MPADRPDILYIITDQQRADALSCVGATAATPNLDRLEIELDGGDLWHDGRRKREVYDDGTVIERDLEVDPLEMAAAD